MRWIREIVEDLKSDIKFLRTIIKKGKKGEPLVNQEKFKDYKEVMIKEVIPSMFKTSWYWIIAILFAFVVGWAVSGKYYEVQCNNFIVDNYIEPYINSSLSPIAPLRPKLPYPPSKQDSDTNYNDSG